MKRAALLAVALLFVAPRAHADLHLPDAGVSVGPTFAYAHARDLGGGFVYGLDAAVATRILWASGGVRVFETTKAPERKVLPYLEIGLWLLVNVGGGFTVDTNVDETSATGPHFFIGLPLPFAKGNDEFFYVEPYYRATYADVGTLHEGGAFVKWATFE